MLLATGSRYPVEFYGTYFDVPESEVIVEKARAIIEKEDKIMSIKAPENLLKTEHSFCPDVVTESYQD